MTVQSPEQQPREVYDLVIYVKAFSLRVSIKIA